jgi:hypothetical protein
VPRSKNKWSYNSTPKYAFMAWCSENKKIKYSRPEGTKKMTKKLHRKGKAGGS